MVKSSDGRPHLVFVASKLIEVGEELLFDYNDRESRLPFLKSCPVCNMTTGRPAPTTTSIPRPYLRCTPLKFEVKCKGSPYSIIERRVPELIPVLSSQPAGDVSHKPGGRLPLLFARPAVTIATRKRVATNFAAW